MICSDQLSSEPSESYKSPKHIVGCISISCPLPIPISNLIFILVQKLYLLSHDPYQILE